MRNPIAITSVLIVLAAPAAAVAAPAKLSRVDASAGARTAAAQAGRGLEQFGYHAVSATLDHPQRMGRSQFRTVVSLLATATRPGALDGVCLLAVYTWRTGDRRVVSRSSSLSCTPLF